MLGRGVQIPHIYFIVAVKLLAISIRKNNNKIGIIVIEETEITQSQSTGDDRCFICIFSFINIINLFGQCAKFMINRENNRPIISCSLEGAHDAAFGLVSGKCPLFGRNTFWK